MTTVAAEPPVRTKGMRPPGPLALFTGGVVAGLQARVLRQPPDPEATGALARLRRGIGAEPGSDYTLERYLCVPDEILGFVPADRPADTEYAVHDAVTLYALHQQSQRRPMHVPGTGLGAAVATLLARSDSPEGVRRRFAALGTASAYPEVIYHLRGLVTMLRGEEIPLDYGRLAEDLVALRTPTGPARIRAAWGRDFYRSRAHSRPENNPTTDDAPEENGS